jgi:hypothetical protein
MSSFALAAQDDVFEGDRSEIVNGLLQRIESNMKRRQERLDADKKQNQVVAGRTVSKDLANIKGFQKHVSHMKNVRMQKAQEEVPDTWGHGTLRKGELYLKYNM